jgi:hypothetical protein
VEAIVLRDACRFAWDAQGLLDTVKAARMTSLASLPSLRELWPLVSFMAQGGVVMTTNVRALPIAAAARVLLGGIVFVHGLNGFLLFLPPDLSPVGATRVPERALTFVAALVATGYVFPLVNAIEMVAGALLLSNRFVPLALTVLAPIIVNMLAFHVVLAAIAPAGTVIAAVMLGLEVYLAWTYGDAFRPMLVARANEKSTGSQLHAEPRTA